MRSRLLQATCCTAATLAFLAFLAPGIHADDYNKMTYFTFSGAVQVPGVTLPAGTYTFKLADPATGRRVIQIWDKGTSHLLVTALTIPDQRLNVPADKPIIMFKETPSGEAPAVREWFYPGESTGYEFVYPKNQARKIAMASHQPVASLADNSSGSSSAFQSAPVGRVDSTGQFSADSSSATASAAVQTPAPVATGGTVAAAPRELPRTASLLPLIELLSGLSLLGAFGARAVRKHLTEN